MMKQSGTSKNWGGARQGAGRKPADLSDAEVKGLIKAFRQKAKETKKPVGELLADIAYDADTDKRLRLRAIELYYTLTVVKRSHKTIEDHSFPKPTIYLPERKKPTPEEVEKAVQVH